jgi:hypothetical protein
MFKPPTSGVFRIRRMLILRPCSLLSTSVWLLAILFHCSPLFGETLVKVGIPGKEFVLEPQAKGEKRVELKNVDAGIRVRAPEPVTVVLRAVVHLPSPHSADAKVRRLVIQGRTSSSYTSLQKVELLDAGKFILTRNTDLSGDFSTKETKANAWSLDQQPVAVSAQTVVRLTIRFSGGFEGVPAGGWDFILSGVELEFPPVIKLSTTTLKAEKRALQASGKTAAPAPAVPAPPAISTHGVIYSLSTNDELLWFRHLGLQDGSFRWEATAGKVVGTGWGFKQLFSGGEGVVYAITASNDLLWYRHDGRSDGTFRWAGTEGKKVGEGWDFKQVFSGGAGVIYAITASGDLLWYRHDGRGDGSFRWASMEGKKVGEGWNFPQVFSGGDGVIYAVTSGGDLLWYRHEGRRDGSFRWAASEGKPVGSGWNYKQLFSAGSGVIYGVAANGDLMWYRHDGYSDGSVKWAAAFGKKVGAGWDVKAIFSGE